MFINTITYAALFLLYDQKQKTTEAVDYEGKLSVRFLKSICCVSMIQCLNKLGSCLNKLQRHEYVTIVLILFHIHGGSNLANILKLFTISFHLQ